MQFKSYLQLPFEHKKLEKLMVLEGVALAPGVYTGIDGKTVEYPREVIRQVIETMPGKTILFSHTTDENPEEMEAISVGYFQEAWNQNDRAMYRGIVYNPDVWPLIENGTLHSGSLELDVKAEFDPSREIYVAKEARTKGMALTNRPAVKEARIHSHEYVTQVRLEALPENKTEVEKTSNEDKAISELAKKKESTDYPMPAETPWGEMSDEEKYKACVLFFKNKGYPYPYPTPVKQEELDALFEAFGIDLSAYTDFMKKCLASGKSMKECAAEWKAQHELVKQLEAAKQELEAFQKAELERLINEIKSVDKKFDEKQLLEGIEDYRQKKALLERYKNFLETHKPRVKLELGEGDWKAQLEARRKKIIEEMNLSPDLRALLEEGDKKN
ncbi:MAG: hypothetical protein DRO14_05285 [Thermoprotei archaeon]|nr:MAG: hypothetical protein DRO14_05285 [Thermoprotei archaeon]